MEAYVMDTDPYTAPPSPSAPFKEGLTATTSGSAVSTSGITSAAESCGHPTITGWFGGKQAQPFQLSKGQLWQVILVPKLHLGHSWVCRQTCTVAWHFLVTNPASFFSHPQISRAPLINILYTKPPLRVCFLGNPTWHMEWLIHMVPPRPFSQLPLRFWDGKDSMMRKKLMLEVEELKKKKRNQSQACTTKL